MSSVSLLLYWRESPSDQNSECLQKKSEHTSYFIPTLDTQLMHDTGHQAMQHISILN